MVTTIRPLFDVGDRVMPTTLRCQCLDGAFTRHDDACFNRTVVVTVVFEVDATTGRHRYLVDNGFRVVAFNETVLEPAFGRTL